jgi:hypothetical protein
MSIFANYEITTIPVQVDFEKFDCLVYKEYLKMNKTVNNKIFQINETII